MRFERPAAYDAYSKNRRRYILTLASSLFLCCCYVNAEASLNSEVADWCSLTKKPNKKINTDLHDAVFDLPREATDPIFSCNMSTRYPLSTSFTSHYRLANHDSFRFFNKVQDHVANIARMRSEDLQELNMPAKSLDRKNCSHIAALNHLPQLTYAKVNVELPIESSASSPGAFRDLFKATVAPG